MRAVVMVTALGGRHVVYSRRCSSDSTTTPASRGIVKLTKDVTAVDRRIGRAVGSPEWTRLS